MPKSARMLRLTIAANSISDIFRQMRAYRFVGIGLPKPNQEDAGPPDFTVA